MITKSKPQKFTSKYTDLMISANQKLAEIMIERQNKNIKLPQQFWNDARWKRNFLVQLRLAASLLKLYDADVIIKGLESRELKNVYSLGAKWIDPVLLRIKTEMDNQAKAKEIISVHKDYVPAILNGDFVVPKEAIDKNKEKLQELNNQKPKTSVLGKLGDL